MNNNNNNNNTFFSFWKNVYFILDFFCVKFVVPNLKLFAESPHFYLQDPCFTRKWLRLQTCAIWQRARWCKFTTVPRNFTALNTVLYISPFITQPLCTTLCIIIHISVAAPKPFSVDWRLPQGAASNRKFLSAHQWYKQLLTVPYIRS